MAPRVVVVVLSAVIAATGAAQADAQPTSLQRYLSSMSWPLRASFLRARTVSDRIDSWIAYDDPPGLGQIALSCRNLRGVESQGRVIALVPPARLRASHARLVRRYSAARDGCAQVRLTALATRRAIDRAFRTGSDADKRTMHRAMTAARATFRRFENAALRSFGREVIAWRSAVVRELKAEGLPSPKWLDQLA